MSIISVETKNQLDHAIINARSGDTIILSGGEYGVLDLNSRQNPHLNFSTPVKIISADIDDPAVFTSVRMRDVANITLDGLKFDLITTEETKIDTQLFRIDSSNNITISNGVFDGDNFKGESATLNGYGTGFGLRVMDSDGIVLENSVFTNLWISALFGNSTDLTILGNNFEGMSGDGIKFSGVEGVLVEGNFVGAHRTSPDNEFHRDKIQLFSRNATVATRDVTIRDNTLHSGDGDWSQSIFMRNEAVDSEGKGQEMYYRDILIENNLIYNAHVHGIHVGETDGLIIRNNTLLHNIGGTQSQWPTPKIRVVQDSKNVVVTENISHGVPTPADATWTVADNLIVQRTDTSAPNHYDALFVDANRPNSPVEELQPLTDGLISTLGVGATIHGAAPTALIGTSNNDILTGGRSADAIFGLDGDDTLTGGGGNDRLDGGAGSDRLLGGDGNDTFLVRAIEAREDRFDGGAGGDTIEVATGSGPLVLRTLDAIGVETFAGNGADVVGTAAGEVWDFSVFVNVTGVVRFLGLGGADIITGSSGADHIDLGSGRDLGRGGTGNDTLFGGTGNDTLFGGDGDDVLLFGSGLDTGDGGAGNDRLMIRSGEDQNDAISGGAGTDTLVIEASGGDAIRARLTLTDVEVLDGGRQSLLGTAAGNTLDLSTFAIVRNLLSVRGGAGNDTIIGCSAADTLLGEQGDDTIIGGRGNDRLAGGAGDDVFRFVHRQSGTDRILDFDATGNDTLRFEGFTGGLAQLAAGTTFTGESAQIELTSIGGSGSIILQGVTVLDFTEGGDFTFI